MKKRINALLLALIVLMAFAAPGFAADTTTPGLATVNKTIAAADAQHGLYDVTLSVTGSSKSVTKPVDVVLVIDASGSMEGTSFTNAKAAAFSFAQLTLEENSANRVAIVKYNEDAAKVTDLINNIDTIKDGIDGIKIKNYTNIAAGFTVAKNILTARSDADKSSRDAVVVLLSDGVANRGGSGHHTDWPEWNNEAGKNNTDVKAAIEAGQALVGTAKVYTIALLGSLTGQHADCAPLSRYTLTEAVKDNGSFLETYDSAALSSIYTGVIHSSLHPAVLGAAVADAVTDNFLIVSFESPGMGTVTTTSAIGFKWDIGDLGATTVSLTYRIKLIDNWTGANNEGLLDTLPEATLTYEGGSQISPEPTVHYRTLTVNSSPAGIGAIAVKLNGSQTARTTFALGVEVIVTQEAKSGFHFTGWSGDFSASTGNATVIMDGNKTITANYAANTPPPTPPPTPTPTPDPGPVTPPVENVSLTMAVSGQGTILPSLGINTYGKGTTVQLTATPAAGWKFSNWQGDAVNSLNQIYMDGNKSVTAVFSEILPTVTAPQIEVVAEVKNATTPEVTEPQIEEIAEEAAPAADAADAAATELPKTGGIPTGIFYGLGGVVAAVGLLLRRKLK